MGRRGRRREGGRRPNVHPPPKPKRVDKRHANHRPCQKAKNEPAQRMKENRVQCAGVEGTNGPTERKERGEGK